MRKAVGSFVAVACIVGATASPAAATTETGSVTCPSIARAAVTGEQQRLDRMVFKVSGTTIFDSSAYYEATRSSGYYGTRTWSATADTLLLSETRGWCLPR